MRDPITLFCLIDGQRTKSAFAVQLDRTETFGVLKEHILRKNRNFLGRLHPWRVNLWKVSIRSGNENCPPHNSSNALHSAWKISRVFPTDPPEEEIQIYIEALPSVARGTFFFITDSSASYTNIYLQAKRHSTRLAKAIRVENQAIQQVKARVQAQVKTQVKKTRVRTQVSKQKPQPQM